VRATEAEVYIEKVYKSHERPESWQRPAPMQCPTSPLLHAGAETAKTAHETRIKFTLRDFSPKHSAVFMVKILPATCARTLLDIRVLRRPFAVKKFPRPHEKTHRLL
jgi:hypothetical protein